MRIEPDPYHQWLEKEADRERARERMSRERRQNYHGPSPDQMFDDLPRSRPVSQMVKDLVAYLLAHKNTTLDPDTINESLAQAQAIHCAIVTLEDADAAAKKTG